MRIQGYFLAFIKPLDSGFYVGWEECVAAKLDISFKKIICIFERGLQKNGLHWFTPQEAAMARVEPG